jgi:hypothetical protein
MTRYSAAERRHCAEKNVAAPRLTHIFEIDAIPSADALGYLDVAAPRLGTLQEATVNPTLTSGYGDIAAPRLIVSTVASVDVIPAPPPPSAVHRLGVTNRSPEISIAKGPRSLQRRGDLRREMPYICASGSPIRTARKMPKPTLTRAKATRSERLVASERLPAVTTGMAMAVVSSIIPRMVPMPKISR